mgnify:CR=1
MEELMDAIELGDVFQLIRYLDKIGYRTDKISLNKLHSIQQHINEYLSTEGIQ